MLFHQLNIFNPPKIAVHHKRHQGAVLVPAIVHVSEMAYRFPHDPFGIVEKSIIL